MVLPPLSSATGAIPGGLGNGLPGGLGNGLPGGAGNGLSGGAGNGLPGGLGNGLPDGLGNGLPGGLGNGLPGGLGGGLPGGLGGALDNGPLGALGAILDLNLENPKTLLAIGDEKEKAAVGLLAKKKMDSDRQKKGLPPVSEAEWQNPQTQQAALAGLDLNNKQELLAIGGEEGKAAIELLSKKRAERAQKEAAGAGAGAGCPPSEGVFHAYAIQSGNPQAPRYAVTFANPKACEDYAAQLQKDYPSATTRQSAQFFSFPQGVDPTVLAQHPNYAPFADKMFFTPISGPNGGPPHAVLPPMDRKGHVYTYEIRR